MAASIDQQFIEYIVKSLVNNPDAVKIERRIDEKGVLLELTVDPEDLGRVIGKRGATAQSLRTLLRALGTKNDARYNLKIVDNGAPAPKRDNTQNDAADDSAAADEADGEPEDVGRATNDDTVAKKEDVEPTGSTSSSGSSLADRTRAELADLDDLDV
jgi:predicted RNA-binding protein YlqC (UPF0109 family)